MNARLWASRSDPKTSLLNRNFSWMFVAGLTSIAQLEVVGRYAEHFTKPTLVYYHVHNLHKFIPTGRDFDANKIL